MPAPLPPDNCNNDDPGGDSKKAFKGRATHRPRRRSSELSAMTASTSTVSSLSLPGFFQQATNATRDDSSSLSSDDDGSGLASSSILPVPPPHPHRNDGEGGGRIANRRHRNRPRSDESCDDRRHRHRGKRERHRGLRSDHRRGSYDSLASSSNRSDDSRSRRERRRSEFDDYDDYDYDGTVGSSAFVGTVNSDSVLGTRKERWAYGDDVGMSGTVGTSSTFFAGNSTVLGSSSESIVSGLRSVPVAAARMLRRRDAIKAFLQGAVALALIAVVENEKAAFRFSTRQNNDISNEPILDPGKRKLSTSLDLGGGACKWQAPVYDVPDDVNFHKTLIAGFPSGDKRLVWLQMEALAGWPAKDEWDFAFLGMSNHPFIKGNYPHHEGFWGWGDVADQTVLMVPYIRRSMVEYHDVLWDLGYPTTWGDPKIRQELLYNDVIPHGLWYEWRDQRVMDECHWWSWFIDYWMEGGLLRDVFTHKKVTLDHWQEIMIRPFGTREQLDFDRWGDSNVEVPSEYDPHCENDISGGCSPVEIISPDRLLDHAHGPDETEKIARALLRDSKTGDHVIAQQAWPCIWEELVVHRKGPKTIYQRPGKGYVSEDNEKNFSVEMLQEMMTELNRLITKYNGSDWRSKPTAGVLVELLMEHAFYLQAEINEVKSGRRKLATKAFLGPRTRDRRRLRLEEKEHPKTNGTSSEARDYAAGDGSKSSPTEAERRAERKRRRAELNQVGQREFLKKRQEVKKVYKKKEQQGRRKDTSDGDSVTAIDSAARSARLKKTTTMTVAATDTGAK